MSTIIKEGLLQKKSRYIGAWRERWTVLLSESIRTDTVYTLCTYTKRHHYDRQTPTERIPIDDNTEIKMLSWNSNEFYVFNASLNERFLFCACNIDQRDEWLQSIISRTDVAALSGYLFEVTSHSQTAQTHTGLTHKKKRKKTAASHDRDSIQSQIDEMKQKQTTKGKTQSDCRAGNGGNTESEYEEKILHWLEMEILLHTNDNTYFQMMMINEFDTVEMIQMVTAQNLSEIGIEDERHRMQIMRVIAKIPVLMKQIKTCTKMTPYQL